MKMAKEGDIANQFWIIQQLQHVTFSFVFSNINVNIINIKNNNQQQHTLLNK